MKTKFKRPKSWFKTRGYIHITPKISCNDKTSITNYVKNPNKIARHAFFPLLHKKITQRRYRTFENKNGEIQKGHKKQTKGKIESNKKIRPIFYATHIDAQIYAYYSQEILQKKYEEYFTTYQQLSSCITAYRKIPVNPQKKEEGNKSSIHFAKDVFDQIKERGECVAMAYDIKNFFTNLDHKLLKKAWSKLLGKKSLPKDHYNIFKSITNFSYVNLSDFRKGNGLDEAKLAENRKKGIEAFFSSPKKFREKIKNGELRVYKNKYHNQQKGKERQIRGIPQGLPISAMLANLYMLKFDKAVFQKVVIQHNGFYRRYSDDIVIVCDEKDRLTIRDFLINEISKYKLKIAVEKTEVCLFRYVKEKGRKVLKAHKLANEEEKYNVPFNYLGFEFYGDKVLIKSSNLAKFYRRMKQAVKTKSKRVRKIKEKYLLEEVPLYKRKLYRIYSYKGEKPRKWQVSRHFLKREEVSEEYYFSFEEKDYLYRGNYLHYIERAAKIMNEPAIKKQLRHHWKILQDYIKQHIKAINVK